MPRLTEESYGSGDQSWIGSRRHLNNAQSARLSVAAFTAATHYPDGYLPSSTPVAKVGGVLVPYDPTETVVTGAGVLAGHILWDQQVKAGDTELNVPLFDDGRVRAENVFGAFTAPVAPAKSANVNIVYIY